MSVNRAAAVDCLYGDTGTTKTSRLGDAAEYYYRKTGKPARLVSSDQGGWDVVQPLIDGGVIIPFKLVMGREHLIQDMQALTQGYWPDDPADVMSPINKGKPVDLSGVSVLLFDGITSMCDMLKQLHVHAVKMENNQAVPTGIKIAGTPRDNFIQDGDYFRRIMSQTDYGEIQTTARELIRNTSFLPIPAIWTALECKGEDDDKKPIYGPKFIGKALTDEAGQLFGNLLHLVLMPTGKEVPGAPGAEGLEPIMFLKHHYRKSDPLKVRFPAQVRVARTMASKVPATMEPNLVKLYTALENLRKAEAEAVATWDTSESNAPAGASK